MELDTCAAAVPPAIDPRWSVKVGVASDPNLVYRAENQDAVAVVTLEGQYGRGWRRATVGGLFDGAGGEADGAGASRKAAELPARLAVAALTAQNWEQLAEFVGEAMRACSRELFAATVGRARSASTAALLLVVEDEWLGAALVLAHVGDTCIFHLTPEPSLHRLTTPHRLLEAQIAAGELTSTEARDHPGAGVLTSALGAFPTIPALEVTLLPLEGAQIFALLVDGVWEALDETHLGMILAAGDPQAAAEQLVRAALAAGSADNCSAVIAALSDRRATGPAEGDTECTALPATGAISSPPSGPCGRPRP